MTSRDSAPSGGSPHDAREKVDELEERHVSVAEADKNNAADADREGTGPGDGSVPAEDGAVEPPD